MAEKPKIFLYKGKEYACTLELAMDIIAGKWKSMLIFHLRFGALRSSTLQHCLRGISNKMFTQSIRELEADGLVRREIFPVIPPKVEYSLTERGKSLLPIIVSLAKWGLSVSENGSTEHLEQCDRDLRQLLAKEAATGKNEQ